MASRGCMLRYAGRPARYYHTWKKEQQWLRTYQRLIRLHCLHCSWSKGNQIFPDNMSTGNTVCFTCIGVTFLFRPQHFSMANRRQRIDLGDYGSAKRAKNEGDVNPWTGRPYSQRYLSILKTRTKLPVYQFKDELINKVMENQCVVVEGETGSGKTTQIGQ